MTTILIIGALVAVVVALSLVVKAQRSRVVSQKAHIAGLEASLRTANAQVRSLRILAEERTAIKKEAQDEKETIENTADSDLIDDANDLFP